jgi:hypothetical protein
MMHFARAQRRNARFFKLRRQNARIYSRKLDIETGFDRMSGYRRAATEP